MPYGLPQGIDAGLVGNYMKRKVIKFNVHPCNDLIISPDIDRIVYAM